MVKRESGCYLENLLSTGLKPVNFKVGVDTGEPGARNKTCLQFASGIIEGADILDVGCWAGAFASMAVGKARSVTAVDIEPLALDVARSRTAEVRFVEGSVLSLPFAEFSFDVVTLWDVLEHLLPESEGAALREIARVLRPAGHLILSVPNDSLLAKALDPMYFPRKHRHYSPGVLERMLESSGFIVEQEAVLGGLITTFDFLLFCVWKYALGKPGPSWARYKRICERDSRREGFVELFIRARRSVELERANRSISV